jgi:hypothetical protein
MLTNDNAAMYVKENTGDRSDYTFRMGDNSEGDGDRFVFWGTSWQGVTNDKWPLVMQGNTTDFYPRFAGDNHITGGMTANSSILHINQNARRIGISNTAPTFMLHVGNNTIVNGTAVARFENAGGTCTVTPNIAGGVACTSDINRKKDIVDVNGESTLAKIIALDVKSYHMIVDASSDQKQIGFIAQNLEAYFPWLVNTDDNGKKEVNYAGMTPIIVSAIQEMIEKMADINEKIDNIFASVVTFGNRVIFTDRVIYQDHDMAGYAIIKNGDTYVQIDYVRAYEDTPIVTISSIGSYSPAYIDRSERDGFRIVLDTPAVGDKKYTYMVVALRGVRTIESDGSTSTVPVVDPVLIVSPSVPTLPTVVSTGSTSPVVSTPVPAPVVPPTPVPTPVSGCTDSTATNYMSTATVDDGSCTLPISPSVPTPTTTPVSGCTDSTATNYMSTATVDDGSCV